MSEQGPERRRATRRRVGKPYAKTEKAPPPPKSSFSSLLSIFTAPFKKSAAPIDERRESDESDTDGPSDDDGEDSTREVERHLRATAISASDPVDATSSTGASSSNQSHTANAVGLYPKLPQPNLARPNDSASDELRHQWSQGSISIPKIQNSSSSSSRLNAFGTAPSSSSHLPRSSTNSPLAPIRPLQLNVAALPPASESQSRAVSPYKEIVDFLQTKKEGDKLNQMEIIGLTQSLRKNANPPAQDMIDYLESAAANVPSAALLGTFKPPTSDISSSPHKPLLFPSSSITNSFPSTPSTPATASSPARGRRRRPLYTGVGQSPRAATTSTSSPARTRVSAQPAPSRLRLQIASKTEDVGAGSNKRRLIGDGGIPIPSGASSSGASTSQNPATSTSTVPFPLSSPEKPQRAPPPTNAGPLSRPTMNGGGSSGPFGGQGRAPIVRPEAPRHPSPLRKSNLDLSISSNGDDSMVDDSFEIQKVTSVIRKTDSGQRSQTSAAILEIIMDEESALPLVKSKAAAELKNPFENMHPTPPRARVSTPVRRPAPRLSRPWNASPAPAPPKRGMDSDNILDQIDSTAPKPFSPKKPQTPASGADDLPGVVNPFATSTNLFAASNATTSNPFGSSSAISTSNPFGSSTQRMKSPPPTTAYRSTVATKVFSSNNATLDKVPSASKILSSTDPGSASSKQQPSIISFFGSVPLPPKNVKPTTSSSAFSPITSKPPQPTSTSTPAKNKNEVVVVDDSDDETEIKLSVPKSTGAKRSNAFSLGEDDDIEVDEVEEDEVGFDDEMGDEEAENRDHDRSASLSPVVSPAKPHHLEHPTSVEEPDQATGRSSKTDSLSPTRRYGSSLGLGIPSGPGHPSFKSSPAFPSPLRQVSIPPSDVDELSETEYGASQEEKNSTQTLPALRKISSFKEVIIAQPDSTSSSSGTMNVDGPATVNGKVEHEGSAEEKARSAATKIPLKNLTSYEIFQRDQITSSSSSPSTLATRSEAELSQAKAAVQALPITSLPTFNLFAPIPSSASSDRSMTNGTSFDWSAAGLKTPTAPKGGEWTCSMCACKSPDSAKKCTVCEEPRPATSALSSAPVSASSSSSGFNWAAAGMKAPAAPKAGEWTCSTCSCKSPDTAKKCTVCDEPRPTASSSSSTPASAISPPSGVSSSGFNWAAAGMKAPAGPKAGEWTCGMCSCKSPDSATKCIVCEAARPSTSAPSSAGASSAVSPPGSGSSGGFDWAAAGMKAPESSAAKWTCSVCMIQNDASKNKCAACESPR